ncbi:MAG: glycosyltransferase family 4 protein [Candidatus Paceibacterota bacterium]
MCIVKKIIHLEPKGSTNTQGYVENITAGLNLIGANYKVIVSTSSKSNYDNDVTELPVFGNYGESTLNSDLLFNYLIGLIKLLFLSFKKKESIIFNYHWPKFSPIDLLFIWMVKITGNKIVATVHNVLPHEEKFYDKIFFKLLYKNCSHLILHTKDSLNKIKEKFNFIPQNFSYIPHYSYPANEFNFSKKNKNTLLFFGNIRQYKGLELLASSIKLVSKNREDWILTIAGNPEYDISDVQNQLSEVSQKDKVNWSLGWIEEDNISRLFNEHSIVVLPYTKIDNSGLVYLAMSYGCTVIAPKIGVFKELITHKKNGLLFEVNNSIDLARKIESALDNSEQVLDMGWNARKLMVENFSIEAISLKYLEVYDEL